MLTEYALRQPAIRVRAVYGASNELADHVLAGSALRSVRFGGPVHLDRLAAEKRIRVKSRRVVATNSLAAIGPEKGPKTISTPRGLLTVRHIVLADPASPLGKCSQEYLEQTAESTKRLFPRPLPWTTRGRCSRRCDRAALMRDWHLLAMP